METLMERFYEGEEAKSLIAEAQDEIAQLKAQIEHLKNKYKPISPERMEELGNSNLFFEHYTTIIRAIEAEHDPENNNTWL